MEDYGTYKEELASFYRKNKRMPSFSELMKLWERFNALNG